MQEIPGDLPEALQAILKGCLAANRAAQARLYHLYANRMMGICMWYSRNREEAEEILQDGFIRVFKYLHLYKGSGSFDAWVRRIMINAALLRYRNKSARLWAVTVFNTDVHDIADDQPLDSEYDNDALMAFVQRLPPAYRLVFNLYVFEGLKHKEIAALLNISEGTSKSNLSDARKILKNLLLRQPNFSSPQKRQANE